ncbi:MAG: hypothetical protein AAB071_08085 [Bacteroidota bacterium]
MVTKELLKSEIDNVPEEQLEKLYNYIQDLEQRTTDKPKESIMEKLRRIQIDGPSDLSVNLDAYLSGEKQL